MTQKSFSSDNTASLPNNTPISPADIALAFHDEAKKIGTFTVVKRNGAVVPFQRDRILRAIESAFRDTKRTSKDEHLPATAEEITDLVVKNLLSFASKGASLTVEGIQDEVEVVLMKSGHHDVAKNYIIYRNQHKQLRDDFPQNLKVITKKQLKDRLKFACRGQEDFVSFEELYENSVTNFYEGMKESEVDLATIMAARTKIELEPAYSKVASRLLLDSLYRETMGISASDPALEAKHREYFKEYLKGATSIERTSPALLEFDLDKLARAMQLQRDDQFTYLGLQTLYDRYFIHENQRRLETPQIFFMRVAMGLALGENEQKNERAIEFYDVLSKFNFMSGTPTLFNSGTMHSQLSSCYLSTVIDDLHNIFKVISDDAQLSKWAGGIGNDWTNVRATGASIKGTNGKSQGVIPFLKVANDTAVAVNQGGKRKGAMCAYLETWHLDIEDFLELRKNTGDERRRTHDMNTDNWIPDLFMKRVASNGMWTLFSPSDVLDLHDLYGAAFEKRYLEYEKMADAGEIKLFKRIEAVQLWRKMLSMLFETGHPWLTFKDPSNIRSPQDHMGVVHCSNLCTEILLNTSAQETAVCNLGSINLVEHMTDTGIDEKKLAATIRTAVRMLDNVIDINFYPTVEARNANLRHRPIGLGIMGFQDVLYMLNISYASDAAVEIADETMEMISYYAILASSELAQERGTYQSYKGSKWSQGYLPIDTIALLEKERGGHLQMDRSIKRDWTAVRESIKKYGMRNSNTMAIAPTATIANITGVTQSIEPMYKHLFVKSNLSGEFTVPNIYLVERLKKLGLWDHDMLDDLKYFDGSLGEIERIPQEIKNVFLTAFEIDPEWLIEAASRRQKWIDMGQSLNLYLAEASGKKLHQMYMLAWEKGLKTTYYLRSLGATQIEKSTTDINKRGMQPRWMKSKSASSNIQLQREEETSLPAPKKEKPKACSLEEGCESCQ